MKIFNGWYILNEEELAIYERIIMRNKRGIEILKGERNDLYS